MEYLPYYSINEFDDGLNFYTLAVVHAKKDEFVKFFFYANIARNYFLINNNFLRVYYLNNVYMLVYSKLNDFENCYKLAKSQYLSLNVSKFNENFMNTALTYFVSTCICLKYYTEAINYIGNKESLPRSLAYFKIIILYKINKHDYETSIRELLLKTNENEKKLIIALDSYLKNRDENSLEILYKAKLKFNFYECLKMIF